MADAKNPELDCALSSPAFMARLELLSLFTKRLLRYRPKTAKLWQGQTGFEFEEYRSYLPGDDLCHVDWNVYRRLNEVVIKEYAIETPRQWVVGLDISASMSLYHKFLFARALAAAIIYIALSFSDQVIFFPFPLASPQLFVYHGKQNSKQMLATIENLEMQKKVKDFPFRSLFFRLPLHAKFIMISDFYDPIFQTFFPFLRVKNLCSVAVHIVARQERHPTFMGAVNLEDVESGDVREIDVTPSCLRNYEKQFQAHILQVKSFCAQHKVAHREIEMESPLSKNVLTILRLAGLLR
jgi:uncharacterized protein (DUF58 family)